MTSSNNRRRLIRGFLALALLATFSVAAGIVESAVRGLALAEAQMAADAGALAGAGHLALTGDQVGAQHWAASFANLNRISGRAPQVRPEEIVVNLDSGTVRVGVHARAYGIPRVLAWILGVEEVSVSRVVAPVSVVYSWDKERRVVFTNVSSCSSSPENGKSLPH